MWGTSPSVFGSEGWDSVWIPQCVGSYGPKACVVCSKGPRMCTVSWTPIIQLIPSQPVYRGQSWRLTGGGSAFLSSLPQFVAVFVAQRKDLICSRTGNWSLSPSLGFPNCTLKMSFPVLFCLVCYLGKKSARTFSLILPMLPQWWCRIALLTPTLIRGSRSCCS